MAALPGGSVTFCFVDLAGSDALFADSGDTAADVITAFHDCATRAVVDGGGVVVRTDPARVFAAFADAAAAVTAMVSSVRNWPATGAGTRLRVGVHTGPAIPHGDDYAALAVHEASRITDAAHPDQILVSETVVGDGAALPFGLRRLGRYRLRDLYEPLVVHQVIAEGLPSAFPAIAAMPEEGHNVTAPRTTFVGRDDVADVVEKHLGAGRLVTVTGPGGVGKTRLAAELARRWAPRYADGVWLVDVGSAADDDAVARAIAGAVGIAEQPGRSRVAVVATTLAARRMLLIVDGSEHARLPVSEVVHQVLAASENVKVLVTSRVALGLDGEAVVRLGPLPVPPPDASPVEVSAFESVQLLVDRARAAGVDVSLDGPTATAIAAACRAVDGIPLALELVAASMRTVRIDQLAQSLRASTDGGTDVTEPLLRALTRTADLLDEEQRALWRRLSVFRGTFDVDRASAVTGFEPLDELAVLDGLADLVDWSVVDVVEGSAGVRFRLLDTVRTFGSAAARAAGEEGLLQDSHAVAYAAAIHDLVGAGPSSGDALLAEVRMSRPDLRAAVSHLMRHDPPAAARLVAAISFPWEHTGDLDEVAGWAEHLLGVLRPSEVAPDVVAHLRLTVANLAFTTRRPDVDTLLDQIVATGDASPDTRGAALLLQARLAEHQGDREKCRRKLEAAEELARDGGRSLRAELMRQRSAEARRDGRYDDADQLMAEALSLADTTIIRRAVELEAGQLAAWSRRNDEAEHHLTRALELADELGSEMGRASAVRLLGHVANHRGDFALAEARYRTAAEAARRHNRTVHYAIALSDIALAVAGAGRHLDALDVLDQAGAPGDLVPKSNRQFQALLRGMCRAALGDGRGAIEDLQRAVAIDPQESEFGALSTGILACAHFGEGGAGAAAAWLDRLHDHLVGHADRLNAHRPALNSCVDLYEMLGDEDAASALRPYCGVGASSATSLIRWSGRVGPLDIGDGPGFDGVRAVVADLRDRLRGLARAEPGTRSGPE